jgi:hypothetical protein
MRRIGFACVVVLILAVAVPAAAGDKHKCTASTQDCLDKLNAKLQHKAWLGIETEKSGGGHSAVGREGGIQEGRCAAGDQRGRDDR